MSFEGYNLPKSIMVKRRSHERGPLLLSLLSACLLAQPAKAEYSQELSLFTTIKSSNGYHLVEDEKKPLTETRYQIDLTYGYFFTENLELTLSYALDDARYQRDSEQERARTQSLGLGVLFNLPDGAKGYALSTSGVIPYIGLRYKQEAYPDNAKLYLLAGQSRAFEVLLGFRYFIFPRIAWHFSAKASSFSQKIELTNENGEPDPGFRDGTSFDIQPFGLALFW